MWPVSRLLHVWLFIYVSSSRLFLFQFLWSRNSSHLFDFRIHSFSYIRKEDDSAGARSLLNKRATERGKTYLIFFEIIFLLPQYSRSRRQRRSSNDKDAILLLIFSPWFLYALRCTMFTFRFSIHAACARAIIWRLVDCVVHLSIECASANKIARGEGARMSLTICVCA